MNDRPVSDDRVRMIRGENPYVAVTALLEDRDWANREIDRLRALLLNVSAELRDQIDRFTTIADALEKEA